MFLHENGSSLLQDFIDLNPVTSLAYPADVFEILNTFNISLHNTEVTIFGRQRKVPVISREVSSLGKKTEIWKL
jgi:hypothetical protein